MRGVEGVEGWVGGLVVGFGGWGGREGVGNGGRIGVPLSLFGLGAVG